MALWGTINTVVGKRAPTPKISCKCVIVRVASAVLGMSGTRPAECPKYGREKMPIGMTRATKRIKTMNL